jgi:hypothetical protein
LLIKSNSPKYVKAVILGVVLGFQTSCGPRLTDEAMARSATPNLLTNSPDEARLFASERYDPLRITQHRNLRIAFELRDLLHRRYGSDVLSRLLIRSFAGWEGLTCSDDQVDPNITCVTIRNFPVQISYFGSGQTPLITLRIVFSQNEAGRYRLISTSALIN